jgi:general secretion pathway protein D
VPPGEPLQLSWRGPADARAGDEVTLVLEARTGQLLSGAALQVTYDPQALEFVRLVEGSFMQRGGASTAVNHRVDAAAGVLSVRLARLGDGVSGVGDLLSLTFRARDPGASALVQAVTVSSVGPGNRMLSARPALPHQVNVAR